MITYNDQYYLAIEPKEEDHIEAIPDRDTGSREYHYQKPLPEDEPFVFENAHKDKGTPNKNGYTGIRFIKASTFSEGNQYD